MTRLSAWKMASVVFAVCAATAVASSAQGFKTLLSFDGANGAEPYLMSLVRGTEGNLYGTTEFGGTNSEGTVFEITPAGKVTTLHSFCARSNCSDGSQPYASLVLAGDRNFYGTTYYGGLYGNGTVFKITPEGTFTTLHSFCVPFSCADGALPYAGLVQASGGNLFGTTFTGGAYGLYGTVFKITPEGTLTTLYNFCSQAGCSDGAYPLAGLVQATDGNFYGTTYYGGLYGNGTVFKITPEGTFTTLYSFCMQPQCPDGKGPAGGLIQGTDGNFYGTTTGGGAGDWDRLCAGCGTVFTITPGGTLTTLYSFCNQSNCTDGTIPGALVQATDGNFYGTTFYGGSTDHCDGGCGTVFEVTIGGTLITLHTFHSTDGAAPGGGLFQDTNGKFYGTTFYGGSSSSCGYGCGTVFSGSIGLGAFVILQRYSGKVGETGFILGQGFKGATSVSLNGTPASFTVRSDTFLTATVPTGATTGYVTVTTPSGTLTSNVPFHVIQ